MGEWALGIEAGVRAPLSEGERLYRESIARTAHMMATA